MDWFRLLFSIVALLLILLVSCGIGWFFIFLFKVCFWLGALLACASLVGVCYMFMPPFKDKRG